MIESPSSFLVSPRPGASLTGTVSQNGPLESLPRTWGPPLTPDLRRARAPRMEPGEKSWTSRLWRQLRTWKTKEAKLSQLWLVLIPHWWTLQTVVRYWRKRIEFPRSITVWCLPGEQIEKRDLKKWMALQFCLSKSIHSRIWKHLKTRKLRAGCRTEPARPIGLIVSSLAILIVQKIVFERGNISSSPKLWDQLCA